MAGRIITGAMLKPLLLTLIPFSRGTAPSASLNNILEPGLYYLDPKIPTDTPTTNKYGVLIVPPAVNGRTLQFVISDGMELAFRMKIGANLTSWRKVTTTTM